MEVSIFGKQRKIVVQRRAGDVFWWCGGGKLYHQMPKGEDVTVHRE